MAKLLVVDDSSTVRLIVQRILATDGHEILHAQDGAEALAVLDDHPDIDAAIVDVIMPVMGGLEFLGRLHRIDFRLPTIILSAEGAADLQQRARAFGAKAWMIKPAAPEVLLALVRRVLPKPLPAPAPAAPAPAAPAPTHAPPFPRRRRSRPVALR